MSEITVKIVKLEAMRVLSAYGFGPEPEGMAWEKLTAFTENNGPDLANEATPTFGFNNPNPSQGSPNYGYEIWLPVDETVQPAGDLRVLNFSGGLYAVTTCKGLDQIGAVWGKLVKWREGSKYKPAQHQWLEELTNFEASPDEYMFKLYLPIAA